MQMGIVPSPSASTQSTQTGPRVPKRGPSNAGKSCAGGTDAPKGQTNKQANKQTSKHASKQTNKQTSKQTSKHACMQASKQTNLLHHGRRDLPLAVDVSAPWWPSARVAQCRAARKGIGRPNGHHRMQLERTREGTQRQPPCRCNRRAVATAVPVQPPCRCNRRVRARTQLRMRS